MKRRNLNLINAIVSAARLRGSSHEENSAGKNNVMTTTTNTRRVPHVKR